MRIDERLDENDRCHYDHRYVGLCENCFASLSRTESDWRIPYSDFWDWDLITIAAVEITATSKAGTAWTPPVVKLEDYTYYFEKELP